MKQFAGLGGDIEDIASKTIEVLNDPYCEKD